MQGCVLSASQLALYTCATLIAAPHTAQNLVCNKNNTTHYDSWRQHVISKTGDPKGEAFEAWPGEDFGIPNGLDLWKAYWIANVKTALSKLDDKYSVRRVSKDECWGCRHQT